MSDLANTQLGQYHLIEAIGHGGMATVYKAYQESLDRHVAIKVLLSNRDPQFAVRFKREARAIAALQHHNILPIYDYGEQNGLLYFVMQYVDSGVTLHDLLGKPMPPAQALRVVGHVLAALEYAHSRGIIHRDLKPANILMPSPNWALLADFGIAKLMNDSQHLTMTGFIIGTAAYMAPEQAAGRPVDARTDLYALGVVLFEMLTGRVPFDADTPMAVLTKHVYEPPPPPRSLNPNLPVELEALLLRALAKAPEQRYQSAAEMAADVERVAAQFERPRPPSQVSNLYQSGVDAFQKGRWDEAVERFSRLVALTPDYEDATMLLNAARLAQAQSTSSFAQPPTFAPASTSPSTAPPNAYVPPTTPFGPPSPPSGGATALPVADESGQPARRGWTLWAAIIGVVVLLFGAGGVYALSRGAAPTPVPTVAIAPTATATEAATAAPSPSPTATATATATETPAPSPTAAATATNAPTATPAPNAVVGIEKMNLRAGPGQGYATTGSYAQGTALQITGKDATGAWIQVSAPDGRTGWMLAEYLRINVDLAGVPVVDAPPTPTLRPTLKPTAAPAIQPTEAPPPPPPTAEPATPEPPTPVPPTATPTHDSGGGRDPTKPAKTPTRVKPTAAK